MSWLRRSKRAITGAELPESVCLLPWVNVSIDVDGSSRPCCKFDHVDQVDGQPLLKLGDATLAEVWDSPGLVQLRREFQAGKRPEGCASCWAEEASGVSSFRQTYLHDRAIDVPVDISDLHPTQPRGLDLKLSNTCNLACRICGPVASSRWLTEELAANPEPQPSGSFVAYLSDNRRYLADNKLTGRAEDRALLVRWAPGVQHLELTGGEPMLSKESAEVLELLVEHGDPSAITLQITTNATTINDRIVRHLDRFRHVGISLSVDDMGPRLEYQRDPAVWAEVEANISAFASMASRRCEIYLNATISALNIWNLPDYVAWWAAHPHRSSLGFATNFLHHPVELSIQHLPEALKAAAHEAWERHPKRHARHVEPILDRVLAFASATVADPAAWPKLLARTAELDARRGQRFADVYPDLVTQLRALDLWQPIERVRS